MQNELVVRGEQVERIFNWYREGKLVVNRRYQRKLVWTVEEKQSFIDSILQGFPVPIFLLAKTKYRDAEAHEIIDGMQRLNAITSFIEGEFDINGSYFDLETTVETKDLLDSKEISQKNPKLSRKDSSYIAKYLLPLSIYSFDESGKVDEIFRRINSKGRYLSKQELRSAGALGLFPDVVRKISAEIREDTTSSDILPLSQMKKVSINNKNLAYGINSENIYWVRQGIISKEMLRQSRDEEIVADSIAYIAFSEIQRTSSEILDELYGFKEGNKKADIETALQQVDPEIYREQYLKTHDVLSSTLRDVEQSFNQYCLNNTSQNVPRYYQILFLAFYDIIFRENKEISDISGLISKLKNIGGHIKITTGGNWSATNRNDNIEKIKSLIRKFFKDKATEDPVTSSWVTEFQTLLIQSRTEQALYDFKQGFLNIKTQKFDDGSFSKIIKTLSAMANHGPKSLGHVCVGVADNKNTANAIEKTYKVTPYKYHEFYITGLDHEIERSKKTAEEWHKSIRSQIERQPISQELKDNILRHTRLIKYQQKSILIFRVKELGAAAIYDGKFYQRFGPEIDEIKSDNYQSFFKRF